MNGTSSPARLNPVWLVGLAYVVVGVGFPFLANSLDSDSVRFWRLAAWGACAALGAAHIGYEHFKRGNPPRATALHAAAGVALGAFGLALAANVHWLIFSARDGAHARPAPLSALPVWPLVTALPVFVLALAVAAVLARFTRRA